MSALIYSTTLSLPGPWLLGREALVALDEAIGRESERLKGVRERSIEEAVRQAVERRHAALNEPPSPSEVAKYETDARRRIETYYEPGRKEVRLGFDGGVSAVAGTFAELVRDPSVSERRARSCEVRLEGSQVRCDLRLRRGELSLSVFPETSEDARQAFIELRMWATQFQAPMWQRFWVKAYPLAWVTFIMALFVAAAIIQPHPVAQDEARVLLERGISASDVPHALEVILMLLTKHQPSGTTAGAPTPTWFIVSMAVGLAVCLVVSIHPVIEFGIGRGTRWLSFWRWWTRTVAITVPVFLFVSILRPLIYSAFTRLISGQ